MEIKTKFNVGDKAFTIYNNNLFQVKIASVRIYLKKTYLSISYAVYVTDDMEGNILLKDEIEQNSLFSSEKELFDSLHQSMIEYVENPSED